VNATPRPFRSYDLLIPVEGSARRVHSSNHFHAQSTGIKVATELKVFAGGPSLRGPRRDVGVKDIVRLRAGEVKSTLSVNVGEGTAQDSKPLRTTLCRCFVTRHRHTCEGGEAHFRVHLDQVSLTVGSHECQRSLRNAR
jgi:hypothetical protein